MTLKIHEINSSEFSRENLIRSNYKTAINGIEIQKYISHSGLPFIRLKEYFSILSGYAFKSDDYVNNGIPVIRIGDVGNDFKENNMVFLPEDYKEEYSRFLLKKNDIIVSLTGDGKLKTDLILEEDKFLMNQRVGSLRIKSNVNFLFYYYLIAYFSLTKKQFYYYSNGKTQLNISPFDFLKIKIPLVTTDKQKIIISQIEPIEKTIKELKATILPTQIIIDTVFFETFKWDLLKFQELKKIKSYQTEFMDFGNNIDIRKSVKFHRKAAKFVLEQLKLTTNKKIKDFLAEPIVLGKGISPSEYDDNGDTFYVAMSSIKNWKFESDDAKLVSTKYAKDNFSKTVQLNDILVARSGEGTIGKVALIDDENLDGIFADFTMRIRLKNYNYLFAYYYFRTSYFQYLVEINKKGLGNNTNIFPSQIRDFPLIDITIDKQEEIVKIIKNELDEQEFVKQQILDERNKIDKIIEDCIKINI
jgi:type I restriction enzyme S subunit